MICIVALTGLVFALQTEELKPFLQSMGLSMETVESSSVAVRNSTILTTNVTGTTPRAEPKLGGLVLENRADSVKSDPNSSFVQKNSGRYLQYYVQGGWGNQIHCLSSAYFIAWATNRTLILSPVVPHNYLHYRQIFDMETRQFQLQYDLERAYLSNRLGSKNYLRLDQALDVEYTLPLVSTVDFREFYRTIYPTLSPNAVWVMERNFTHFNTRWMVGQPELEGLVEPIQAREHNQNMEYTVTIRDLPALGRTTPIADVPIWTLLDSFRAASRSRETGPVVSRLRPPNVLVKNHPRFGSWIRQTAHDFLHHHSHPWGNHTPYASVHIRGSDGPFQKPKAIAKAITQGMENIEQTLRAWVSSFHHDHYHNSNETTTTSTLRPQYSRIGLFVATDLADLDTRPLFTRRVSSLNSTLWMEHNITLQLLWSKDIQRHLQDMISKQGDDDSTFFPYETVGAPSIFLDQQIAACASIGFVGTEGSTFSRFIATLRRDQENVCNPY